MRTEGIKFVRAAHHEATLRDDLEPEERARLVRVGSGTTVRELNADLWDHHDMSMCLLGGFDGQTIGGVLPTGTHGSVLAHGPLAEIARSLDVIAGLGRGYRIEPASGPTDAAKFAAARPGWTLIQDDEAFDAALVHLGAFGVVHSYLIAACEKFHMKEVRTPIRLSEAVDVLRGGNVYHRMNVSEVPGWVAPDTGRKFCGHPDKARHLELLFNAYSEDAVVTTRDPAALGHPEPSFFADHPEKNLVRALSIDPRFLRPVWATWFQEWAHDLLGFVSEAVGRTAPCLSPRLVDAAIAQLPDDAYIQRSYRVFNIGDGSNKIPALSATIFVPLEHDLYLEAFDVIQKTARAFVETHGRYETGPIAVRFVRGSRATLAPGEDVAGFEFIFGGTPSWGEALVEAYDRALHAKFGPRARLHWGQMNPTLDPARVWESYPRIDAWRSQRDRVDPNGRFMNAWLRRIVP